MASTNKSNSNLSVATSTIPVEVKEAYKKCIASMTLCLKQAKEFATSFDKELEESLVLRGKNVPYNFSENSLKSIDAFISTQPEGDERGNYYAIDLGGTNLRAVVVKLSGDGSSETINKKMNFRNVNLTANTPKGLLDTNTPATSMFDAIANLVYELMEEVGDDPKGEHSCAFTFSFPIKQFSINNGVLIEWTKEFETGCSTNDPVEGQDVAEFLNAAFHRKGMKSKVGCLINDTVGTMLSAGYECNLSLPTCRVGVILGTGFNISMDDPSALTRGYNGSMINLECGNFSHLGSILTVVDMELDYYSSSPGMQLAEKVISGNYLCEVIRLWLIKVFQHHCTQQVWNRNSISTEHCAQIYTDYSKSYKKTRKVLKEAFNWDITDVEELRMVYKVVCVCFERSATVAAVMTYVCAHRTKYLQKALGGVTVGIDGSLYTMNERYRKTFKKTLDKLLGVRAELLHCVVAKDGSGKGAAIMAACALKEKTRAEAAGKNKAVDL